MKRCWLITALLFCAFFAFADTADDAAAVNNAIRQGNCAFLYEYINSKNADSVLEAKAKRAIDLYSTEDTKAASYRTDTIHLKVGSVPANLLEKVSQDPETNLKELVSYLIKGASDNFARVKVLHDWICYNIDYDTDLFFKDSSKKQNYCEVLQTRKAISTGFSALMKEMCTLAGFECVSIDGFAKGYGYNGHLSETVEHSWNAVNIESKWYLIDVTWDTGYLERKAFIRCYSSEYLFLDSRSFLYTHLPKEDAFQFYAPVVSASQFEKEPKLEGKFFDYGFSLLDNKLAFFNKIDSEFSFELKCKTPKAYMATTLFTKNGQIVENATWLNKRAGIITPIVDVPDNSEYKARFYMQSKRPFPFSVDIKTVEEVYLPKLQQEYLEKHLTLAELEIFKDAFYKVQRNGKYYYADDPFDTKKLRTVTKIFDLLYPKGTVFTEEIFSFYVSSADSYEGYGSDNLRYPFQEREFRTSANTNLVSPVTGCLKQGETYKFEVQTSDYTNFYILLPDSVKWSKKNLQTELYELEFQIPSGLSALTIYNTSRKALFTFKVEP
ncbi:MAG: hypothetical protein J5631_04040 [Spirochaetaceae bacterium]|nr:hypothetical protein [Spirochaetaceae bacterium]